MFERRSNGLLTLNYVRSCTWLFRSMCASACMCVCERERERDTHTHTHWDSQPDIIFFHLYTLFL